MKSPSAHPNSTLPLLMGITTIVSGALLLLGAFVRAGKVGALSGLGDAWAGAGTIVRFVVMLAILAGLLGAGSAAMTLTWKREHHLDLLAATGFLIAVGALLVGATYNKQYGASQSTPMLLVAVLIGGFVAVLLSGWRRLTLKGAQAKAQADAELP